MTEKLPRRLGKYKLLSLLATGGMAELYLARQTGIGGFEKLVVIKKILPHLARETRFIEMFFDEARIAAQLNHPNVVQIYDLIRDGGNYYIAMEYLEGESLGYLVSTALRAGRKLPFALSAAMIAQVCDGLHFAHRYRDENGRPLNIVHRDVSPQNIIVLFTGTVKLVDFGVAKAASQIHKTRTGTIKGKLAYMAPEVCKGKGVSARTDIFSLGVVLWELLTLRRLYKRENEPAIIKAIITEPVPDVRSQEPDVPEEIVFIVNKALAKDPTKRYQAVDEMSCDIREYLKREGSLGSHEISRFVGKVLKDCVNEKKRLLETVRDDEGALPLELSRPRLDDSMPSHSVTRDKTGSEWDFLDGHSQTSTQSGIRLASKGEKNWLWSIFLIGLGVLIAWAYFRFIDDSSRADNTHFNPPVAGRQGEKTTRIVKTDLGTNENQPSFLTIKSKPSRCKVWIDGRLLNRQTPIDKLEVRSGSHKVLLRCAGYRPQTKSVESLPGEQAYLSFDQKKANPEPQSANIGFLELSSRPQAEVFLGKRKLGLTPLRDVELPAGTHQLRVRNDGLNLEKAIQVVIESGKTTTHNVQLR